MSGVVYCIEREEDGKKYIGQTSNLHKRIRMLLKHPWSSEIGREIKLKGIDKFNINVLEKNIHKPKLNKREKYWIKEYNTCEGFGYNKEVGGGVRRGPRINKGYVKKIMRLRKSGKTYDEITEKVPFSTQTIGKVCRGEHPKYKELVKSKKKDKKVKSNWTDYISA